MERLTLDVGEMRMSVRGNDWGGGGDRTSTLTPPIRLASLPHALTTVVAGEEAETLVGVVPLDLATGHRRNLVQTVVKGEWM